MMVSKLFSRALMLLVALCLVMGQVGDAEAAKKKKKRSSKRAVAAQVLGVNDPRYAAIIMNPVTGEVYHQQEADVRRYPASLTKMMTLYLLFEALEQKKLDLDDRMEVSEYAARMPQTNLSLDAGDRIDVETAIKALVVRSANDVSVVVAEHLAGDVETFAKRMTSKARALGMKNTIFKNPNGLPNASQVTTARDMAKLGIALKRDFPRYYDYFSTLQFSHNGVTYYTHNRVMLRYAGTDGIKTGYINASGFNLVSSVSRGGRPVVGVVMGGGTGRWRDNRMIELLDDAYRTIASRGAARGKMSPGNLPLPRAGSQAAGISESQETHSLSAMDLSSIPENTETEDGGAADLLEETLPPESLPEAPDESPVKVTHEAQKPAAPAPKSPTPSRSKVITIAPEPAPATPAPLPLDSPFAVAAKAAPETITIPPRQEDKRVAVPNDHVWGIQVGAFSSQTLADAAVKNAQTVAARQLVGSQPAVNNQPTGAGAGVYRARLERISQSQARRACEALIASNAPCFTYKMQ